MIAFFIEHKQWDTQNTSYLCDRPAGAINTIVFYNVVLENLYNKLHRQNNVTSILEKRIVWIMQ